MNAKKKEAIMECTSFDELLDAEYGERGTEARENFETEVISNSFAQNGGGDRQTVGSRHLN